MQIERPYLICHMMASLDGKITSGTGQDIFDEEYLPIYDKADEEQDTQGWMCGRVTMRMFAEDADTALPPEEVEAHEDFISSELRDRFSIAVDTKGTLRWKSNTIKFSSGTQREFSLVVIVTKNTPKNYLAYLRSKDISYVIAGQEHLNWSVAMSKLHTTFGIKKMFVQGGGKING